MTTKTSTITKNGNSKVDLENSVFRKAITANSQWDDKVINDNRNHVSYQISTIPGFRMSFLMLSTGLDRYSALS